MKINCFFPEIPDLHFLRFGIKICDVVVVSIIQNNLSFKTLAKLAGIAFLAWTTTNLQWMLLERILSKLEKAELVSTLSFTCLLQLLCPGKNQPPKSDFVMRF